MKNFFYGLMIGSAVGFALNNNKVKKMAGDAKEKIMDDVQKKMDSVSQNNSQGGNCACEFAQDNDASEYQPEQPQDDELF